MKAVLSTFSLIDVRIWRSTLLSCGRSDLVVMIYHAENESLSAEELPQDCEENVHSGKQLSPLFMRKRYLRD